MSDYSEHLISMAGGDGDELDAIHRAIPNEAVEAVADIYCESEDTGSLDTARAALEAANLPLLALVHTQAATLAAVLELANSAGRCGWKLSADEVRAALKVQP